MEAMKLEHHNPPVPLKRESVKDPSTNHPKPHVPAFWGLGSWSRRVVGCGGLGFGGRGTGLCRHTDGQNLGAAPHAEVQQSLRLRGFEPSHEDPCLRFRVYRVYRV